MAEQTDNAVPLSSLTFVPCRQIVAVEATEVLDPPIEVMTPDGPLTASHPARIVMFSNNKAGIIPEQVFQELYETETLRVAGEVDVRPTGG